MKNHITKRSTSQRVLFEFFGCAVSIAIMSIIALFTHSPFVFPSLGPTVFLSFSTPNAPTAAPRNTIIGHAIGVLAGYCSLVITGLTNAGPTTSVGVSWPRVIAAALSIGITSALMIVLNASHPPAGATTLIISLGILTKPLQLGILMLAIILITLLTILFHRLARVPYPLWKATHLDTGNNA